MICLPFGKYAVYICPCQKIYIRSRKDPKKSWKDNLKWKTPSKQKQMSRLWLVSWEKLSRKMMIGMTMVIRKQLWAVLSTSRTADPQMELVGARFRADNKGNGSLFVTYLTSWNICQRMQWNYGAFIWYPFAKQALSKWECDLGLGQSYESVCPDPLFDDYGFGVLIRTWKKETQSHSKMTVEKEIMLR